jgi:chemotaxis protein methyltransferase CheR
MNEAALDNIANFIQQRSRLFFTEHKRPLLKQRLEERLAYLGLPDLTAYWNYLRNAVHEEFKLLDLITINETSFFRNPEQFRFITERIIPELETAKGNEVMRSWGSGAPVHPGSIMKVRILCAGCSTGEEPYSVAMALFDGLRYPRAWDIEILAGDLSKSCIRTASTGYYETNRLKGLPAVYANKYMERDGAGLVVKDEIKRLIKFCHMNLVDVINGEPLTGQERGNELFDIIFCRNVMIYFSPETQQQLVDTLFRLLISGGYLFTGDAEPLHLYNHDFEPVREAGCLIYRKMETSNHVEAV